MATEQKKAQYRVIRRVWLRNVLRYPGYILSIEDIGSKGKEGIEHLLREKAIEKV